MLAATCDLYYAAVSSHHSGIVICGIIELYPIYYSIDTYMNIMVGNLDYWIISILRWLYLRDREPGNVLATHNLYRTIPVHIQTVPMMHGKELYSMSP